MSEAGNSLDDVGALVHDDDGTSTKTRLRILQGVVVHPGGDYENVKAMQEGGGRTGLLSTCLLGGQERSCHPE